MKKLSMRIAFLVLGSVMAVAAASYAQVVAPPFINKAFGATSIPLNGTTSLDLHIENPNITVALTGVGFTDTLPAELVVATPIGLIVNTCGGTAAATAGSGTISLSGGALGTGGIPCDVIVNVTGTTAGVKNNSVTVTSTNGGTGNTSDASITVIAPPTIAKTFNPASIALNATTSLQFTITNPAANTAALTGVAFTDTLPTGLTVANASATVCGGTLTTTAPTDITLSGATIDSNSQCQFNMTVTGAALGNYTNTTGAVSSTNGGTGNTASANLDVATPTSTPTNTPTSTPTNTPTSTPTNMPTSTATPVPVVPTLGERGMLIFGLLIAAAGLLLLIRRH